jgi:PAS domain S-box-containing protein
MSLDAQSLAFTKLLAQASTQHLRLTLEPLPVGLIEITEQGIIESIDESTALKLGFTSDQLQGRSITALLEDCTSDFLKLLKNRQYGSLFQAALRTQKGEHMMVEVVLEPSLQSHKFVCSVIFTTDDVREGEQDHRVLYDNGELGGSMPQLATKNNYNRLAFEFALLVALVALIICFFLATVTLIGHAVGPSH